MFETTNHRISSLFGAEKKAHSALGELFMFTFFLAHAYAELS